MPELITHTIVIGLSIAVIISMLAALNMIRTDTQQSIAEETAANICYQLKLTIEQLMPASQPSSLQLTVPNKLGDEPYSIRASGHNITVISASINHTCIVGTSAQLSGVATGRTVQLTLAENYLTISGV